MTFPALRGELNSDARDQSLMEDTGLEGQPEWRELTEHLRLSVGTAESSILEVSVKFMN